MVMEAAGFLKDAGEFEAESIFSGAVGGARLSSYGHREEWYHAAAGSQVCVRGPDGGSLPDGRGSDGSCRYHSML